MNDKMKNVFDPAFAEFTRIMGEGRVVNFSEDKLKIIDIVDRIYSPIKNGTNMSKPLFIKHLLDSIPDFEIFNAKSEQEKEDYVKTCYLMVWALPLIQTKSQEIEKILNSKDSDKQKLSYILDLLKDLTKRDG